MPVCCIEKPCMLLEISLQLASSLSMALRCLAFDPPAHHPSCSLSVISRPPSIFVAITAVSHNAVGYG